MAGGPSSRPEHPLELVRRLMAAERPKRFYEKAELLPEAGGLTLRLDGRRAMTPGKKPIAVPRRLLAEAIAAEWNAQGDTIDPGSMPVTRLANTAIDGVAVRHAAVRDEIAAYAATDLLYYRASQPEGLVARQNAAWNPILAWAEQRFGVRFLLAEGIVHVAQSEEALAALAAELEAYDDPFRLAGLHLATTLIGSAIIALALVAGALEPAIAWAAAHVDEDWNIAQWGEDREAAERRARRFADFRAAALALAR